MTNTTITAPGQTANSPATAVDVHLTSVFPLIPGSKEPAIPAWQFTVSGQYQVAGNYGIALPSEILVLDADPRNYPEGRDVLGEILAKWQDILPTRVVRTPSGGLHVYTTKDPSIELRKQQSAYPGVDFLSKGHYVVGPGSQTIKGLYKLEIDQAITPLPQSFIASLERGATASVNGSEVSLDNLLPFTEMMKIADPPVKGSRGITSYKLACKGYDLALPLDSVYAVLRDWWNPRGLPPQTDSELFTQCERAYKYAKNAYGCETAAAKFTPDMAAPPVMMTPEEVAKNAEPTGKEDLPPQVASRWQSFEVPSNYKLTSRGVEAPVYVKGAVERYERICGQLAVVAKTQGIDADAEHGLVLEFITLEREFKELVIPRRRLHQDGKLLAQDLAAMGFSVETGKESALLTYIGKCVPSQNFIAVNRTGWATLGEAQEKLVFVFPSGATDANYRYQPDRVSPSGGAKFSGTLNDWVQHVFGPVSANQFALYEILKSLSAPLLMFAAVEGGGEHLHGRTTTGKTTLIQIGASVWGNGVDPSAASGSSYIHRWNTTANALEGLLAEHNDLPAYFDELGSYGGADFGKLVYNATSGAGKDAMDIARNLKKKRSWRTLITSTGELSTLGCIEENSFGRKKTAKGGQIIRIVDRELKESTFSSASQVEAVKLSCSKYYGTLGRAFIDKIIEKFSQASFRLRVNGLLENARARIKINKPAFNSIQLRASNRFALAEVAGVLLVELGLIPELTEQSVRDAVDTVINEWEPTSRQLDDGERAIQSLRRFLLTHRDARFKRYGFRDQVRTAGGETVIVETPVEKLYGELAGYFDDNKQRYCIYPSALKEATGLEPEDAAKELDKRGLLMREKPNKLRSRISVDGARPYVYAVSTSIISGDTSAADELPPDFSGLI